MDEVLSVCMCGVQPWLPTTGEASRDPIGVVYGICWGYIGVIKGWWKIKWKLLYNGKYRNVWVFRHRTNSYDGASRRAYHLHSTRPQTSWGLGNRVKTLLPCPAIVGLHDLSVTLRNPVLGCTIMGAKTCALQPGLLKPLLAGKNRRGTYSRLFGNFDKQP